MSKIIKKWILDDSWAIGRNESWFSDMAKRGLHLKKIGRQFAHFEKGEVKQTEYRVDVFNEPPIDEQLQIYKECGWNLVTKNREFYIFSSSDPSCTIELHTDPAEQSYTLNATP